MRAQQGGLFPSLSASFQPEREKISSAEFASFGPTQLDEIGHYSAFYAV